MAGMNFDFQDKLGYELAGMKTSFFYINQSFLINQNFKFLWKPMDISVQFSFSNYGFQNLWVNTY